MYGISDGSEDVIMAALLPAAPRHCLSGVMVAKPLSGAQQAKKKTVLSSLRPRTAVPSGLGPAARRRR